MKYNTNLFIYYNTLLFYATLEKKKKVKRISLEQIICILLSISNIHWHAVLIQFDCVIIFQSYDLIMCVCLEQMEKQKPWMWKGKKSTFVHNTLKII